jgi:hypothetical protein
MITLDAYYDTLPAVTYDKRAEAIKPIFARVLHCSQSPYTGYKRYMDWRGFAGKGDPSVFKYVQKNDKIVIMTRQIQQWIFGLIRESAEGSMTEAQLITSWTSLTANARAFNDGGGRDQGYADYILHVNEGKEGMKAQPIMCTGHTLKLKGDPYKAYGGVRFQDFEILDVKAVPDPIAAGYTWANRWWLIMAATNSLNLDNGGERIDPFPKMAGDRDTPWPLMGFGTSTGTIQRDWLQPVTYEIESGCYPYLPWRQRGGIERWDLRNA